jgi:cation:H+ antiporter
MLENFFLSLPLSVNILFIIGSLYVVIRASHYLVDGAVYIAHELGISPLVIGATVVAMGTSSCELAINLVVVLGGGDTSTVVGNILGSNLVNLGIELGVSVLIAGFILVHRSALEKDFPLYLAASGMVTVLVFDGQIDRIEAVLMLALFVIALILILQYARAKHRKSVLLVEVTEIEAISHPTAVELTHWQALFALFGGLAVLVLASRLLIYNTSVLATSLRIPQFIIGLVIIGPGTSLPEIASSIQAARRGHADIVIGTVFGSNLFNLLFGLGLPAVIHPLSIGDSAILSFVFMNVVNISLLCLLLLDTKWLAGTRFINRLIGAYLVTTYVGFISYQVIIAAGGTVEKWLEFGALIVLIAVVILVGRQGAGILVSSKAMKGERRATKYKIICATRGGQASLPTHERAISLALERGAEIIFLYVFDQKALQGVATPIVINVEAQMKHMLAFLRTTAQEQARRAGVPARIIVRTGSLRDQIKDVSISEQANLVIMGNPAERSSLFKREALQAIADEVEESTGVKVLVLGNHDSG